MTILVIDIGNKYLKFTLLNRDSDNQLAFLKIGGVDFENKNFNLLSREIERKYQKYNEQYNIDDVYIIPNSKSVKHAVSPRLEYYDDKKQMYTTIKNTLNDKIALDEPYILDWSIQVDNPEEDYKSVFGSSINQDYFFNLITIINKLGLKKYKICSGISSLSEICPKDGKAYMLVDIGHAISTIMVVMNGEIMAINSTMLGSKLITDTLLNTQGEDIRTTYITKHNSNYSSLSMGACTAPITQLGEEMKKTMDDFQDKFLMKVSNYILIGGTSYVDMEVALDNMLNIKRLYPKLDVVNANVVPLAVKNYVYQSVALVKKMIATEDAIDFLVSKDGGLGIRIKNFLKLYNKVIYGVVAVAILFIGLNLNIVAQHYLLNKTITNQKEVLKQLNTTYSNKKNTLTQQQSTLQQLNVNTPLIVSRVYNWGELLSYISSCTPKGLYISKMISTDGNNFEINGYSDTRYKITDYSILLKQQNFKNSIINSIENVNTVDNKLVYKFKISLVKE